MPRHLISSRWFSSPVSLQLFPILAGVKSPAQMWVAISMTIGTDCSKVARIIGTTARLLDNVIDLVSAPPAAQDAALIMVTLENHLAKYWPGFRIMNCH